MVRPWIANPSFPSSNLGTVFVKKKGGRGGMVDTTDLKSVDLYGREGSSPSDPNIKRYKDIFNNYIIFDSSVFIPKSLSIAILPVLTISTISKCGADKSC